MIYTSTLSPGIHKKHPPAESGCWLAKTIAELVLNVIHAVSGNKDKPPPAPFYYTAAEYGLCLHSASAQPCLLAALSQPQVLSAR